MHHLTSTEVMEKIMEIRIDNAYEKVYISRKGDTCFYFYATFYAPGITPGMSESKKKKIVIAAREKA